MSFLNMKIYFLLMMIRRTAFVLGQGTSCAIGPISWTRKLPEWFRIMSNAIIRLRSGIKPKGKTLIFGFSSMPFGNSPPRKVTWPPFKNTSLNCSANRYAELSGSDVCTEITNFWLFLCSRSITRSHSSCESGSYSFDCAGSTWSSRPPRFAVAGSVIGSAAEPVETNASFSK